MNRYLQIIIGIPALLATVGSSEALASFCAQVDYQTGSGIPDSYGAALDLYYFDNYNSGSWYQEPIYRGTPSDLMNTVVVSWLYVMDESEDACQWYDFFCNGPTASWHLQCTPRDAGGTSYETRDILMAGPIDSSSGASTFCEFYLVEDLGPQFMAYRSMVVWDKDDWLVGGSAATDLDCELYESDEGWGDDVIGTFTVDLTASDTFDVYVNNSYAYMILGDDDDGNGWADRHEVYVDLSNSTHPYHDDDGDGVEECWYSLGSSSMTLQRGDCDDTDDVTYPGAAYNESSVSCRTDSDSDGYGSDEPASGVTPGGDCDDEASSTYPGATDTWYDGIDSDCMEDSDYDADGDGQNAAFFGGSDCDDGNAFIFLGAVETWYDGVDSDCGEDSDYDADGDGQDAVAFGGFDCDDQQPTTYFGAPDEWYDGVDSDCGRDSDYDADRDGFDADGYGGSDCDDGDPNIHPRATEIPYNGIDEDCQWGDALDADGDGQDVASMGGSDCDDTDSHVFTGAPDTWYDGVDSDCARNSDYDADGDGQDLDTFGGTDCDDADPSIYLGAPETWYDGIDSDCAGDSDFDMDGDGQVAADFGGTDCDDADAEVATCGTDTALTTKSAGGCDTTGGLSGPAVSVLMLIATATSRRARTSPT